MMYKKESKSKKKWDAKKSMARLVGDRSRIAGNLARYAILIGIGFVFLYPILYMVVNSLKSVEDLVDPAIEWLPRGICFDNFVKALNTLSFGSSFANSLLTSLVPAILQSLACAVTGYALARFSLPGKKLWIALMVAAFITPTQVLTIPRYLMFNQYKMINTLLPQFLPALLGQGLKSSLFILVYFNFFSTYPKSLDESAFLEGAGRFTVFCKVAFPLAVPAHVVSFLFSFVWYWNETSQASLMFGSVVKTLPMKLGSFADSYKTLYAADVSFSSVNEAVSLAGTLLSILPLLIFYLILQKQFVESIEKSGITGE